MINTIDFDKLGGLVPAIVQDADTRQILMLGFMNREAVEKTMHDKKVTFWSRTRKSLWQKGETSGNTLNLVSIHTDCDKDALLVKARPTGPVCHTGDHTCFGEEGLNKNAEILSKLESIILDRKATMPEKSYTARLFAKGIPEITQKVGEESVETIVAALNQSPDRLREESADLLYHLLVLLAAKDVPLDEVFGELKKRM
jgi:phosphoribosyl-AMP cyclohydrolase / phosphoribosyl-ATP pyrophosphohydrolase